MALFGTGVMKGPFATDKEYPSWGDDGEYSPMFKTVPQVEHVSCWDFIQTLMQIIWMKRSL